MFQNRSIDCEQSREIDSAVCSGNSVQPVRLNPINGGAWCLPALHPDIPHVLDMGDKVTEQILANLALEAHAHGVALPGGKFTTTKNTLQAQWNAYIAAACGPQLPLSMDLGFSVSPTAIKVHISPAGYLAVLRMKPVVDALNKARKGLGWWVLEAASAATQDRYPIYRVQDAADFLEYNHYAGAHFSDESFIEEYNNSCGEDLTREQMEEEGQFFWPSDLIKAVDGHTWLLARVEHDPVTHQRSTLGKKPYIATIDEVHNFLKGRAPKELKTIVADFLALCNELTRADSFMKDAAAPHHEDDVYENGTECIGASCALVWDNEEMALELIQHHEVEMQEHGEYEEIHIEFKADPANQVSVSRLVQSIKDFVTRHAAIGKAFSHFEVIT